MPTPGSRTLSTEKLELRKPLFGGLGRLLLLKVIDESGTKGGYSICIIVRKQLFIGVS